MMKFQLTEERVSLGLWVQRNRNLSRQGGRTASSRHWCWEVHISTSSMKQKRHTGSEVRPYAFSIHPPETWNWLPSWLHLLKLPKQRHLLGYQVFKHMSLGGTFFFIYISRNQIYLLQVRCWHNSMSKVVTMTLYSSLIICFSPVVYLRLLKPR